LEYGTLRSRFPARRRSELEAGLKNIQHVPFDSDAAATAARIRVELEKRGVMIEPLDMLIAGTALSRGAALVTNNAAEFSRVPGLRIVDWRA
jgi:tRNA(fMet)-specific endonuclease VapC